MKKLQHTTALVLGISALFVHVSRGQIFRIDMDSTTPAIDTVISPPLLSTISVGVYLDLTGGGAGYPAGMSIYGVSLAFDNTELSLMGAPAATQSIPTLVPFGFGTLGVPAELGADLGYDAGGTWGSIKSFAGFTLGAGPVNGLHLLGTVNFKVNSIVSDGFLDVIPGFFNAGVDGLFDNASAAIPMPPANFVGGSVGVVPEPSVSALLLCGTLALWMLQRGRHR